MLSILFTNNPIIRKQCIHFMLFSLTGPLTRPTAWDGAKQAPALPTGGAELRVDKAPGNEAYALFIWSRRAQRRFERATAGWCSAAASECCGIIMLICAHIRHCLRHVNSGVDRQSALEL